jgi:xanthine dehydrogenase large subunit
MKRAPRCARRPELANERAAGCPGPALWAGQSVPHESARANVTGRTVYLADMPRFRNELSVELEVSPLARARIVSVDVSEAARVPGIAAIFTAADVPGDNRFGAIEHDEELLASLECQYVAQPIVALAGETGAALKLARRAVKLELQALPAVLSIDQAIAAGEFLGGPRRITRGDAAAALARAEHVIEGSLHTGGQEHFYLETQAALAVPGENGSISVYSSTQNPSEVQAVVAHCLGLRQNQVVCIATRMGGAFGGKESQAAHPALLASLVAHKTGRPARLIYPRNLDMRATGKRHPYLSRYRAGFGPDGRIDALELELYSDGGSACDLSLAVMDRSILHADNAYYIPHFSVNGIVCRTNLPPNTAMRGFGAPQGIAAIENVIEDVAAFLGIDPLLVRRRNLYGEAGRDVTPYGEVVSRNTLPRVIEELAESSDYARRRDEAARFSAASLTYLRGLSLLPVKFGISFTRRTLNQGSALVNIFTDGTIQVSTGGTEMGQGLFTKIGQVVADCFAVPIEAVRVMPTSTEKNHNTSPTAASASTDLNGTAALRACEILKHRLSETAARHLGGAKPLTAQPPGEIAFDDGWAIDRNRPDRRIRFDKLVRLAYEDRVELGARGFYATPGIDFDREKGQGTPFLYYTNGAAVSEVLIDRLTGELSVTRVDILLDLGRSINPAIDRGQVIGGYVQGMGWATTEELIYSSSGELLSDAANNYKVPSVDCIPADFRVRFLEDSDNPLNLLGSKAVGEPPFVLGLSVWAAAKAAVSSLVPGHPVGLNLPATSEEVMRQLCECGGAGSSARAKAGRLTLESKMEANTRATTDI